MEDSFITIIESISIVLTTIIAVTAVLTGLGFIFNMLLNPLKESHIQIKKDFEKMHEDFKRLDSNFKKLDSNFNELNSKVDQLLIQKA